MAWTKALACLVGLGLALSLAGCVRSTNGTSTGSGNVSLIIRDDPPAGVDVLTFNITVLSAKLEPGDVQLLNAPVVVNVVKLQTESGFLGRVSVPANTSFTSVSVDFANPDMTILNNSAAAIGNCAVGSICEFTPTFTSGSLPATFSASPFPLNLAANASSALRVDFDLTKSISTNSLLTPPLVVSPSISFTELPAPSGTAPLAVIEEIRGEVMAVDSTNNQFTLLTLSGQTFTAKSDSTTVFTGFDKLGLSNSFTSLATGQNLDTNLGLGSDGTFLASRVEFENGVADQQVEGALVSIDSSTQIKIVVDDEAPDIVGIDPGNLLTVTLQNGTTFSTDPHGLTIPTGLTFATSSDLMLGQEIRLSRLAGSSGTAVTADSVILTMSQITGSVSAVSGTAFTIDNLPSLIPPSTTGGTATIIVDTSSGTEFQEVTDITGLQNGNAVSVRGLLFHTSGIPQLVAEAVRKR